ncbi:MAG: transporter substrate-binding domain-containing protein [Clostridiales bacterium]|nr:transporter substrate-binding domain-containing protein [Clostridiales bacterium]
MRKFRWVRRLLVFTLSIVLCLTNFAFAEQVTIPEEVLATLQAMGFSDIESAMQAYGVTSIDELLLLLQQAETMMPAQEEAVPEERTFDGKVLATMEMEASAEEIYTFFTELLEIPIQDFICYPTVNEALMALKTGKVDTLLSMDANATFMAQMDPTLYLYMDPRLRDYNDISFSMVVLATNPELCQELNEAIAYLKENGILDALTMAMIKGTLAEIPPYEADKTLYVGVTGDIPPIDYVDESGMPVGFNVNLMSQIGVYLGYKIEFVQLSKNAIIAALASGKIDVVFWQEQSLSPEMLALLGVRSDAIISTDPYLIMSITAIELK